MWKKHEYSISQNFLEYMFFLIFVVNFFLTPLIDSNLKTKYIIFFLFKNKNFSIIVVCGLISTQRPTNSNKTKFIAQLYF